MPISRVASVDSLEPRTLFAAPLLIAESEGNNTRSRADSVVISGVTNVTGTATGKSDRDYFRFTASTDKTLDITVKKLSNRLVRATLTDATGQVLASTDPAASRNATSARLVPGKTYFLITRTLDRTAGYTLNLRLIDPAIDVDGNRLERRNKATTLRGINLGDVWLRRFRPDSDFDTLQQDWKSNVVRLSVHPGNWQNQDRVQMLDALDRNITAATRRGLIVVIDWHAIGFPDGYFSPPRFANDGADFYDSSFPLSREFWQTISKRFGANERVVFDLWNAPVDPSDLTVRGSESKNLWPRFKPFYQTLLADVRVNSSNVVIAAGNHWAYNLKGVRSNLLNDPLKNVAYAFQLYAGKDDNQMTRWASALDRLNTVAPVIVTEWGYSTDPLAAFAKGTAADYGAKVTKFFESNRLSSIASYWQAVYETPLIESDFVTPTTSGSFVKRYLASPGTFA